MREEWDKIRHSDGTHPRTTLAKLLKELVRPAGVEPATSWFVVVAEACGPIATECYRVVFWPEYQSEQARRLPPLATGCDQRGAQNWAQWAFRPRALVFTVFGIGSLPPAI